MTNEFMREERYIVFKMSDVERYLTDKDRANITMMKMEIDAGRDCANKPTFKGLIVEADWPEYEPTWKAIEARVTGAQPAPSFADAYQGAMEEAAIWKKRALEAEDLNRKLIAEINGPTHMGEPAPSVPDGWQDGVKAVADMLQKKANDYAIEYGHDDMGGLSFGPGMNGEIKMDHYTTLLELVDEVKAMLAAAPEAKP